MVWAGGLGRGGRRFARLDHGQGLFCREGCLIGHVAGGWLLRTSRFGTQCQALTRHLQVLRVGGAQRHIVLVCVVLLATMLARLWDLNLGIENNTSGLQAHPHRLAAIRIFVSFLDA